MLPSTQHLKEYLSKQILAGTPLPSVDDYDLPYEYFDTWAEKYENIPWWVTREQLRLKVLYPRPTTVLKKLQENHSFLAIHQSMLDPKKVAYTPDEHHGTMDRQVSLTLGKLIAKLYPYIPAHRVQELEADHLAELDETLEILRGPAITAIYESGAVGACMSKDSSVYLYGNPTRVYDMPNIGMAVARNGRGEVVSRCMVYEHSPEDKRYIRLYNPGRLESLLIRNGYKQGTWVGAKLKLIPTNDYGRYVMPYLDGKGGPGCTATSSVALLDGELTVLSGDQAQLVQSVYGEHTVKAALSTGGYISLEPVSSDLGKCSLSGLPLCIADDLGKYYTVNGPKLAHKQALESSPLITMRYIYLYGDRVLVSTLASEPSFEKLGRTYLATDEALRYHNFVRLSTEFYPVDTYANQDDVYITNFGNVRQDDAELILLSSGSKSYTHRSLLPSHLTHLPERGYWCSEAHIITDDAGNRCSRYDENLELTWDGLKVVRSSSVRLSSGNYVASLEQREDLADPSHPKHQLFLAYITKTFAAGWSTSIARRRHLSRWIDGLLAEEFAFMSFASWREGLLEIKRVKDDLTDSEVFDHPFWLAIEAGVNILAAKEVATVAPASAEDTL